MMYNKIIVTYVADLNDNVVFLDFIEEKLILTFYIV